MDDKKNEKCAIIKFKCAIADLIANICTMLLNGVVK